MEESWFNLIFNTEHSIFLCMVLDSVQNGQFCASLYIRKEKRCFILGDLYFCCKCCKTVDLRKKTVYSLL